MFGVCWKLLCIENDDLAIEIVNRLQRVQGKRFRRMVLSQQRKGLDKQ